MKRNNKHILLPAALLLLSLGACQNEEIDTFDLDESKVYFQVQSFSGSSGSVGYSTSTSFSFVDRDISWSSVTLRGTVQTMGYLKDYDRPVRVVVDDELTTMPADGYQIDLDTIAVKAGEASTRVAVKFFRTSSILSHPDTLVLRLEANEHFNVLDTYKASNSWSNTTAGNLDGARYTFIISEIYTQPGYWSNAVNYFGDWNPTRYSFINSYFGFTVDDWLWAPGGKVSAARFGYYARELQKELQRRADAGDPVYDEDGSFMQLPGDYAVDYSNVQVNQ